MSIGEELKKIIIWYDCELNKLQGKKKAIKNKCDKKVYALQNKCKHKEFYCRYAQYEDSYWECKDCGKISETKPGIDADGN